MIGDLTVKFPWHSQEVLKTAHLLTLEGGAAFGTGEGKNDDDDNDDDDDDGGYDCECDDCEYNYDCDHDMNGVNCGCDDDHESIMIIVIKLVVSFRRSCDNKVMHSMVTGCDL